MPRLKKLFQQLTSKLNPRKKAQKRIWVKNQIIYDKSKEVVAKKVLVKQPQIRAKELLFLTENHKMNAQNLPNLLQVRTSRTDPDNTSDKNSLQKVIKLEKIFAK